jgi:hypothetical protein
MDTMLVKIKALMKADHIHEGKVCVINITVCVRGGIFLGF